MFPIRLILIWIWIRFLDDGSGFHKKSRKYQIFVYLRKIISPKNDMFCSVWGKYLCPLNKSWIFFEKIYYILVILVDFCRLLKFSWFWLNFLLPGSGKIRFRFCFMKRIRIRNTEVNNDITKYKYNIYYIYIYLSFLKS